MNIRESDIEKINVHEVSKYNIRVYEFQAIDYLKFYGLLSKVFGPPNYQRMRKDTLQENWHKRELFINVSYIDDFSGSVNLSLSLFKKKRGMNLVRFWNVT